MVAKSFVLAVLPFIWIATAVGGIYAFFLQSYGIGIALCGTSIIVAVVERRAKATREKVVLMIFRPIGLLAAIGGLYAFWVRSYDLGILLITASVIVAVVEWRAEL